MQASTTEGVLARPLSPARILIFGGILIALAGMLFGEFYAIFHLHQSAATIEDAMLAAVQAVARGDAQAVADPMATIGRMQENMGTKKDTHSHWVQLAYLCLILGLIQPYIALGPTWKKRWASIMVGASFILPLGVFTIYYFGLRGSPLRTIGWGSIIADTAGAFVILAIAAELVGAVRYFKSRTESEPAKAQEADPAKDTLLRWGVVLILVGFLHGAYYAAFGLYQDAERGGALLQTSLSQAMSADLASAEQAVRDFNWLQAEKAIYIATHTHLIDFGMLAVLLAFAQPFVFLAAVWKLRWARLLIVGSFLLPLAVQGELWWGLFAGGVAVFGGMLVVVALGGMLAGAYRYTGATEARGGQA